MDIQANSLQKFFHPHRTNSIKAQIQTFRQLKNEPLYRCWEHYNELLNMCLHHDLKKWRLIFFFHHRLSLSSKQPVETMYPGEFIWLDANDAEAHL